MRERAPTLVRRLYARRDAPVAAGAGRRLVVDDAGQAERLLDLRIAPAVRELQAWHRQREVERLRKRLVQRLRGVARVEVDMRATPGWRRVQDPRMKRRFATGSARMTRGPRERALRPAHRLGWRRQR